MGTLINESGADYLLVESEILAGGSLMGFIRRKYYNRCMRVHDILALVMERKLYDRFFSIFSEDQQNSIQNAFSADISNGKIPDEQYLESNPLIPAHIEEYELFF